MPLSDGCGLNGEVTMYKNQLKFQKIVCLFCVIVAAIAFVYSLGILTDLYDSLYFTMRNPDNPDKTQVPGSRIFYDMQGFNKQYVNVNLGLILISCLLFLTNTNVRRKYYIGNYVAIGLYSVSTLGASFWAHGQITAFIHQFKTTLDFEALKSYSETWGTLFLGPDDTFLLDLHNGVTALFVIAVALLLANMIWKIVLMRGEEKLLNTGKEAAV